MCLNLYIGSRAGLPPVRTPELHLGPAEDTRVSAWFTQPVVQFVGAHGGCSCGFPTVVAEAVITHFDGLWAPDADRTDDLRSVSALLALLHTSRTRGERLELFAVWNGDEHIAPKGVVELDLDELTAETFVLTQQFLYRVSS
jgi:hypothetical protein